MIDDRGRVLAQYAWAADGKVDDPLQGDRFADAGRTFAWTIKRYLAGEISMVERPEDLPPEAESERAFLLKRGVRSWLSIPFRSRGVAIGYQSFETLSYTKRWSEEEISALRLIAEIFDRVTEPFFTTKAQGSGLGLAIVHGLAQQCRGALELESEPGCGTIAHILLPVANSTPTQASVATQPDPITPAPAEASLNVLLIEDEEMVRALERRVFEAAGHRVIEAVDGLEALERAQQIPGGLDVLVTDVVMPRMGGLSLARELRRLLPGPAIVVVSGYPDGASDADASDLPADVVFLFKPFKRADLLAAIEDARARVG